VTKSVLKIAKRYIYRAVFDIINVCPKIIMRKLISLQREKRSSSTYYEKGTSRRGDDFCLAYYDTVRDSSCSLLLRDIQWSV